MGDQGFPPPPPRVTTGVAGLDEILGGGLFKGGIYVVAGPPGAGKTIFANQVAFHHVRGGGNALYVTLLAETHARMLGQLQVLSFFDPQVAGKQLKYVNGFTAVEEDGLSGLLKLLRAGVREQRADLLVLDGLVTASALARSGVDYKKFISELQTWAEVLGCTVIFLTSASADMAQPEHTMVDGIFELRTMRADPRLFRLFSVLKFRGSGFTEGAHTYLITSDGMRIFPRLEAYRRPKVPEQARTGMASSGIPRVDQMMRGGCVRGSTTLVLGSSGAGKTLLGLHFLDAAARRGEKALHFGFFENPRDLLYKAQQVGLDLEKWVRQGLVTLHWQPPAERLLDEMGEKILTTVEKQNIRCVFIDGLVGFKEAYLPERLSRFLAVLSSELSSRGVTTLVTEETRELFIREVVVPTTSVSAVFQNIVFLRQVEVDGELQGLFSVLKTRDTDHDRGLHELAITSKGIEIGEVFRGGDPLGSGLARARVKKRKVIRRRRRKG